MAVVAKKIGMLAVDKFSGQLMPMVLDRVEPMVESRVRSSLRTMKQKYPAQVRPFLTTWAKLDKAVRDELGSSTTNGSGGKRHTRTRRRKRK